MALIIYSNLEIVTSLLALPGLFNNSFLISQTRRIYATTFGNGQLPKPVINQHPKAPLIPRTREAIPTPVKQG